MVPWSNEVGARKYCVSLAHLSFSVFQVARLRRLDEKGKPIDPDPVGESGYPRESDSASGHPG